MKLSDTTYTFVFAAVVCVVCSVSLAAVSQGLKRKQETNVALDIKKNILRAVGLADVVRRTESPEGVLALYEEKIEEFVVDGEGAFVEGEDPTEVDPETTDGLYPLYVYKEGGEVRAYAFPVVGQGLWSTLYGYFALGPDGKTVKGITFYKHGETPGLGAEIESEWFRDAFRGKSIWSESRDEVVPIRVVKGGVEGRFPEEKARHLVDGISGATMTSRGVTEMLERWIRVYNPFFERVRNHQVGI